MMLSPLVRYLTRYVALAYVLVLVIVPVAAIGGLGGGLVYALSSRSLPTLRGGAGS